MKIQYASDLHLELSGNSKYVKEIPFEVTGDVLVLAGDTAYLRDKNLPTMAVVAPHHKRSPLNTAFAVELHDYIADSRIDVWIYGHSHTNIDTEINGTKVVCNQLGYVQRGEHEYGFDGRKFVEV